MLVLIIPGIALQDKQASSMMQPLRHHTTSVSLFVTIFVAATIVLASLTVASNHEHQHSENTGWEGGGEGGGEKEGEEGGVKAAGIREITLSLGPEN